MRKLVVVAMVACGLSVAQEPLHLTLAEAEKLAIQNNPALSSAKFIASAAGQVAPEIRSGMQPQLSGSLTGVGADAGSRLAAGGLNNPVVYNRLASGLTLSQMVTDFGRTKSLIESAGLRAAAEDQIAETVRANILLETDRAYFAVLRAQSLLTVGERTVSARKLLSDQVDQLTAAKLKSQLDSSFAKVNLADAELQLSNSRNALKSAIVDLSTVMGIPARQDLVLAEENMPAAPPDRVDPLVQLAIDKRPELAGLRLQANAAERFLRAEKALNYPTVGLAASAGFVPAADSQVPSRYGAIGANVNIPIFNGGLFKARRTEAEYRALAAHKDVEDRENRIIRDVRAAYLNAVNAFERVALTVQLLDQSKLSLELAQARYNLGLSSIVELSQAQLNYTTAQIVNASAKYDYQLQNSIVQYQTGMLH